MPIRLDIPLRAIRRRPRASDYLRVRNPKIQLRSANGFGGPPQPQPGVPDFQEAADEDRQTEGGRTSKRSAAYANTAYKMFESAATTFASLLVLGLAGYGYHRYYKRLVLEKMENAFAPGDPVLELAALSSQPPSSILEEDDKHWITRSEQAVIDNIVNGTTKGHYHLLIGEKGTGKSSMLLDAMQKVGGEGLAMFEAHADLEIFRIRLGKALDYEFHEDYIGSLFSIRGPRDTTALLDIERAFNKLEKVALRRRRRVGRPLVLIVNSVHLLRDDGDGRDLLELIQQRAEQWAASNLVTVVLNSDDYWVYERLKGLASRMEVLPIMDLPKGQAIAALAQYRATFFRREEPPDRAVLERVYDQVGGRPSFLNRIAKSADMLAECAAIRAGEKSWLLNQCWILGADMDDDVMDQQKFCSAALVLARALVEQEKAAAPRPADDAAARGGHALPEMPLHAARAVMTRADFIQQYDHINIFTIDSRAMVRADSVPMQHAFREICAQPGFEALLQATLDRIGAIESLGRTREVVAKDLLLGGTYRVGVRDGRGREVRELEVRLLPAEEKEQEEEEEG